MTFVLVLYGFSLPADGGDGGASACGGL